MPAIRGEVAVYGDCQWMVAQDRAANKLVTSSYHRQKEMIERILAVLLLVPTAPLLLLLVLLVRLTSRGPGLFSQTRVGKNGRPFRMHKIRTMRIDAEAATGPVWGSPHDPRATRIGTLLRRLHLDELPQLINVVKGDMSLVGPRPERPEFVRVLSAAIPGYLDRIAVRPGITGLAQLNLPPDTDLNCVRRKVILDREYVDQAGLWLDFRLLACTGLRVFKLPERWLLSILRLRRNVTLAAEGDAVSSDGNGDRLGIAPANLLLQLHASPCCRESANCRKPESRRESRKPIAASHAAQRKPR
ncbi:MAG: sugar transferase [Planctomycetaceae bacterium]|nr:sugar transferase [Planctomycetaceae bacterium]